MKSGGTSSASEFALNDVASMYANGTIITNAPSDEQHEARGEGRPGARLPDDHQPAPPGRRNSRSCASESTKTIAVRTKLIEAP